LKAPKSTEKAAGKGEVLVTMAALENEKKGKQKKKGKSVHEKRRDSRAGGEQTINVARTEVKRGRNSGNKWVDPHGGGRSTAWSPGGTAHRTRRPDNKNLNKQNQTRGRA